MIKTGQVVDKMEGHRLRINREHLMERVESRTHRDHFNRSKGSRSLLSPDPFH